MKSLNKTLSLVLALCLVFSLMGVAGAADFKDDAKIQYNEAVDVMTDIGAINGIGHDTFAPTASVTRAEAAKMVCYAVLGADVAKNLPVAATKFTDVDATAYSWAIGSIKYLTSKGIINGTSATTFEPEGKVTAFQLGKMLLCAAGYGVNGEFTGPNWAINVSVTANKTDVFKGTKAKKFDVPATREEAALYCFNGISKVHTATYNKLTNKYDLNTVSVDGTDYYVPLYSETYDNLRKSYTTDDFGRPCTKWTNSGVKVGTYANDAAFTYTKNLKSAAGKQAIRKDLKDCTFGEKNDSPIKLKPCVNGKYVTDEKAIGFEELADYISKNSGNGTVISVYTYDDDDTIIRAITVIKEDLAKVTFVNTAKKSVKFETITNTESQVAETYEIDSDNPNYAAVKDLEEDDRVLITPFHVSGDTYAVAKVVMPETETGFIGAVDTHNGKIYLGTTAYDIAAAKTKEVEEAKVDTENKATLWLDALGFVVDTDAEAQADKDFIFVIDSYNTLVDGKIVPMVKGILTDGSTISVAVNSKEIKAGQLYGMKSVENSLYELNASPDGKVALAKDSKINSYNKKLDGHYYAADVKFVFVNTTAKSATVKTGVQQVTKVPEDSVAVLEKKGNEEVITAVYLVDGVAATVDSDSLLYVPMNDSDTHTVKPVGSRALYNETTKKYETYNLYAAFLNGELVEGGIPVKNIPSDGYGFYSYAKSDDTGAYILAEYDLDEGTTAVKAYGGITNSFANKLITVVVSNLGETIKTKEIDISSAKICDSRSEDDQVKNRITPTAKGLCRAANEGTVVVSVIYNERTGTADVVYIASASTDGYDIEEDTLVTFSLDDNTYANHLDSVPAGTKVYVKTSAGQKKVTATGVALTEVKAPSKTAAAVYSFTMPMRDISAEVFGEEEAKYDVSVTAEIKGKGKDNAGVYDDIVVDTTNPLVGDTVTVTVTPTTAVAATHTDKVTITITKADNTTVTKEIDFDNANDTAAKTATFEMPAQDVTVSAAVVATEIKA